MGITLLRPLFQTLYPLIPALQGLPLILHSLPDLPPLACHSLPIRPGRNLAIIVETAAVNHRQKKMGYNAAQELYKRVQANLAKKREGLL